jgi:hypothetical protein
MSGDPRAQPVWNSASGACERDGWLADNPTPSQQSRLVLQTFRRVTARLVGGRGAMAHQG